MPVAWPKFAAPAATSLYSMLPLSSWMNGDDVVLVDRPGRGYGDDYTPWLVDGEVGQLLHARAVGVSEEGILAVAA